MNKSTNAKELNEEYKDYPTKENEISVDGKIYIVVSHFIGEKDLDNVVYKNAYNQAMHEVLHA
jgi:hypothetical protein